MVKLSIILPCYNVSKYLDRCFDSIYSQNPNYKFEVIAVNDASTDDTLDKLMIISQKYPNIRIINKSTNEKLTGARTSGIKSAKGEYIMNVDPDDYLLPNSLNNIFDNNTDWDVMIMNVSCQMKDGISSYPLYKLNEYRIFNLKLHKDRAFLFRMIKGSCFAKVYKASLCSDLLYYHYNYNIGEDFTFNFEVFNKAQIVIYNPILAYSYQYNSESLARTRFNVDRLDYDNSWIKNVIEVLRSSVSIYSESQREIVKLIERYSIGLLLQINKEPIEIRRIYLEHWKSFFINQLLIYSPIKRKWYAYLLSVKASRIYISLFFVSLLQWGPLIERIKRLFKTYN